MDKTILNKLRPWQIEPAQQLYEILRTNNSAVDCSDTGTGKTYVAVAVAASLRLPTLVVVPKISVTAWNRVAEYFGDSFSIINYEKLRTGNTEFGRWKNQDRVNEGQQSFFVCQCCQQRVDITNPQPCDCHVAGIHCLEKRVGKRRYGNFEFHPAVKMVIFDEVHRCGGINSLNAELLIAARRADIKTLGLSATLACDPLKLRALGYMLDLHNDKSDAFLGSEICNVFNRTSRYQRIRPNFYRWAASHGCRIIPPLPGLRWSVGAEKQKIIMANIRQQIIPARGVRVTTESIPGFPECDITAELYDINESTEINALYSEMAEAINILDTTSATDKAPYHPLTRLLRASQRIELLKVPVAVELATDAIEKGLSVGLFVNFKQTMDELRRRLNCNCFIDGSPEGCLNRQFSIDEFLADRARLIIVNSKAGGICVGLQDLRGEFPRMGLVFPCFSATTIKQVFGRFPRDGGKSKSHYRVILAAGTVEQSMHRKLQNAFNNLDAFNDGDCVPDNWPLTKLNVLHTVI